MIQEPDFIQPSNKFTVTATVHLTPAQLVPLYKYFNLHYLGDVDANHLVNGQMVTKYPEKETQEFKTAVWNADASHLVELSVEFDLDGKPTFEIVK